MVFVPISFFTFAKRFLQTFAKPKNVNWALVAELWHKGWVTWSGMKICHASIVGTSITSVPQLKLNIVQLHSYFNKERGRFKKVIAETYTI